MIESIEATSAEFAAGAAGAVACACGVGDGVGDGFSFWPMAILVEQMISKTENAANNRFIAVLLFVKNKERLLEHNPSEPRKSTLNALAPKEPNVYRCAHRLGNRAPEERKCSDAHALCNIPLLRSGWNLNSYDSINIGSLRDEA